MHLRKVVRRMQSGAAVRAAQDAAAPPRGPTLETGEIHTRAFSTETLAVGGAPQFVAPQPGSPQPRQPAYPYPQPYPSQSPAYPPQSQYPSQGPRFEESEHERIVRVVQEGVSIPQFKAAASRIILPEDKSGLRDTNIAYPLIPRFPKEGEQVLAYAHIHWNGEEVVYDVVEPPISEEEQKIIARVKLELEERLDVDFTKLGEVKAKDFLRQQIQKSFGSIGGLDDYRKAILTYYIERDVAGLGHIEPLMNDPNIEDISCDGVFIPLFVYHRDSKLGSLRTNVIFEDTEELNIFVLRIAQKANKSISVAAPLLDAALPDGSRIQATLGTDIARKGSNFCVKEALVQLADGSLEDIRDLFARSKESYGSAPDEHGNDVVALPSEKAVGADEATLTQRTTKVLNVIKLAPPERLVRIRFKECGKHTSSIEVTENHKFHILAPSGIEATPSSELRPGQWVCVPARIGLDIQEAPQAEYKQRLQTLLAAREPSSIYIRINDEMRSILKGKNAHKKFPHLKEAIRGKTKTVKLAELQALGIGLASFDSLHCIARDGRKGRGAAIELPLRLSEELAYFVGWVIGDGCVTKNGMSIHTGLSAEHKAQVLRAMKALFGVDGVCYPADPARIYLNSGIASRFLHECFSLPIGKKSRTVDAPKLIEKSPNSIVAAFLRGLFEADGSWKRGVSLTTASEQLARKAVFLLARLGVPARPSYDKKTDIFRVNISSAHYERFAAALGIRDPHLQQLIARHDSSKTAHILPFASLDAVLALARSLGIKSRLYRICNLTEARKSGRITFETAQKLVSFVKSRAPAHPAIAPVERLLSGAFEFKQIAAAETVRNTKKEPVYDIVCNPVNFYIGGKDTPLFLHDTIRKFTEKPLTPTHMLRYKTLDGTQLAYLWCAIEHGQSILISGSTAAGKTSLLNALSLFIRPSLKVVSIEDTPELRLPLPHWVPHVARSAISVKGKSGEVTLFDLLKSSLRQRPDYIIVGEVRGKEAFVLFQQLATGHSGLATIHAASISQLIDRLTSPPISLPAALLENINIVIFLTHAKLHNEYVRRADTMVEIVGIAGDRPVGNTIFVWDTNTDTFEPRERSVVLRNIAKRTGVSESQLQEDLLRRRRVLEWMLANGIDDYREVARIINLYYTDLPRLFNLITRGGVPSDLRQPAEPA